MIKFYRKWLFSKIIGIVLVFTFILYNKQTETRLYARESKHKFTETSVALLDLTETVTDNYTCVEMRAQPHPIICLHPIHVDRPISEHILKYGAFEADTVKLTIDLLSRHPDAGLIDIGGNIGQYSLVAAKLGHKVVAVEPLTKNARRFSKSVQLNRFTNLVKIVQNGVRDNHMVITMVGDATNQGATKLEGGSLKDDKYILGENAISTITMDDLLPLCDFTTAIIKMDVEASEARALFKSAYLFTAIRIPYIMME